MNSLSIRNTSYRKKYQGHLIETKARNTEAKSLRNKKNQIDNKIIQFKFKNTRIFDI